MTQQIQFRKATPADAGILADLRIRFAIELSGAQDADVVARLHRQMTGYFERAAIEGTCISIIAECNGEPVGIGTVHLRELPGNFKNPSGKWGYIMNMYTVPAYRNMGICGNILRLLEEEGTKSGVTAFELHATEKGKRVYVKHDFSIHQEPTLRKFIKGSPAGMPL